MRLRLRNKNIKSQVQESSKNQALLQVDRVGVSVYLWDMRICGDMSIWGDIGIWGYMRIWGYMSMWGDMGIRGGRPMDSWNRTCVWV